MLAIFRRDFEAFFESSIGYVFIAAFLLIMNVVFYVGNIMILSTGLSRVFDTMLFILMFLLPLLTMRLFSEEFKLKTDQLLLTSPVSMWGIVLGKFFASLAIVLIALAGTCIWVIILCLFGNPDGIEMLGNYFAMICFASSLLSIGLMISSLTENLIISAVSSFMTFFCIYMLGFTENFFKSSIIRFIAGWLSLFTRYSSFTRGLFSLNDIVYYLSTTVMFLFITKCILEKKRLKR